MYYTRFLYYNQPLPDNGDLLDVGMLWTRCQCGYKSVKNVLHCVPEDGPTRIGLVTLLGEGYSESTVF